MSSRKTRNSDRTAEQLLDDAFAAERSAPIAPTTSLEDVRRSVAQRLCDKEKPGVVARLLLYTRNRPVRSLGMAAALAVVCFSLLVPIPYRQTIGYSLIVTTPPDQSISPSACISELQQHDISRPSVNVNITDTQATHTILGLNTGSDLEVADSLMTALTGGKAISKAVPIVKRTSGTLSAITLQSVLRIGVPQQDRTDQEIAAEIAARLSMTGHEVRLIVVERSGDGNIAIDMEMDTE